MSSTATSPKPTNGQEQAHAALLANPSTSYLSSQSPYSSSASSRSGSETSLHKVKNLPGYTTPVFKGKAQQRSDVEQNVAAKVCMPAYCLTTAVPHLLTSSSSLLFRQGFIPRELVANEVGWFYDNLGIDDTYFQNESVEVISDHIIALFGAKILAYTKHDPTKLFIELEKINDDGSGATFIHNSPPGVSATEGPGATCERR